ncbi:MAG: LLM class flavin-dependent oxidoreductase [Chloroflexi bacterium]|nr:LLM class flavin-dependent oxidoreductase [Chloroflexota bacterium]
MDVKFAATSRPGAPQDLVQWVREAEDLGYDRIGIADSPALYREAWVSVTQVALNTSKVPFGPWVTNPVTRHPVVTASAAVAVDELAQGRVCIGIGSGNSGVYNAGRKASSVAALREYVLALRALLEEGEAVYQGGPARLRWAKKPIPIYMAAHAERSLRLAGEVADGVVIGAGTTPEVVKGSLEALADGARSAGRDTRDIDVWWSVPFNLRMSERSALDPQGGPAREANYLARFTLEGKFIPEQHKEGIKMLAAAYDLTTHGRPTSEQLERYDRLAQDLGVRDYLLERFGGISGTPDECIEKLKRNAEMGVTQYSINLPDSDRPARLRRMRKLVISKL